MKNKSQFRQGDVLIQRVENIDTTNPIQRDRGRVVLAYGEVTGHAHAILDEGVTQYAIAQGLTALEIKTAVALLKHEEHGTISLAPGQYRVVRQREYTPEEIRPVAD